MPNNLLVSDRGNMPTRRAKATSGEAGQSNRRFEGGFCLGCPYPPRDNPMAAEGVIGVDVFFVLSGHLISSIILTEIDKTGDFKVARFLGRRAIRLLPAFYALLIGVFLSASFWPTNRMIVAIVSADLFISDYEYFAPILGHTWSLSVEWHFYLLWPLVLYLTPKEKRVNILAMLFVAAAFWRIGNAAMFGSHHATGYRMDTRCSGLILGSLIAAGGFRLPHRFADGVGFAALTFLAATLFFADQRPAMPFALMQPAVDLAAGFLLVAILSSGRSIRAVFSFGWLPYWGLLSYSFYLWHYPIWWGLRSFTQDWRILLPIIFVFAGIAAFLSYELIETPVMNWRKRSLTRTAEGTDR
jgi:peptidoglycan/LPS O-acetylase OafA/YrhL